MAYNFKAGTLSTNGLIPTLGVTAEIQQGVMTVTSKTDWISRLNNKNYTSGPTGSWRGEWLSVYQFLDYGYGTCYVGGTGSTGSYMSFSLTSTPLHNSSLLSDLDVVFDCGNTYSAGAAANIANSRQDCVALIGNRANLTDIDALYDSEETDFGITLANTEYVSFIGGRKQLDIKSIYATWPSTYSTTNFSADVAGLMAYNANVSSNDYFPIVAGVGPTKAIKNVLTLTQTFSDLEATYLKQNNINPVRQYAGFGVYLLGNKTYKNNSNSILDKLNSVVILNYIKRNLKTILREYLFKSNNEGLRESVKNSITSFLKDLYVFSTVAGGSFTVICDSTNNTTQTISQGKLVVNINLTLPAYTESIILNVINDPDGETVFTVTLI
jgi:hypothetical protein